MIIKHYTIYAIAMLLLLGIVSCTGQSENESEKYRKGWTLVWEDNMDEADASVWQHIPRGDSRSTRYMSESEALYVYQDGNLVLRGLKNNGINDDIPFLTGGITRKGVKSNKVQRIEVRARVTPVGETISYISMLPANGQDNISIDFMKRYGTDKFIYQSITSEYTTTEGMPDNPASNVLVGADPDKYHIYGVEKYPDSLVFFVDGQRTRKYPRILTDIPGQFPFNDLDFDLHIGVQINFNADAESLPVDMFVDWVRVYEPATETKAN